MINRQIGNDKFYNRPNTANNNSTHKVAENNYYSNMHQNEKRRNNHMNVSIKRPMTANVRSSTAKIKKSILNNKKVC